jgi:DNA-3-methyladenine glycosylase
MFGPAGHLYVYFTYGMHFCMNVVTGRPGEGSAVLLRAAEPLEGLEEMARLRETHDPRSLCSGPARLCRALAVGRGENGLDLVAGRAMFLLPRARRVPVGVGPRIGIRQATDRNWRFFAMGNPFLSRRTSASMPLRVMD